MAISDILTSIDREISQLQEARALLGGGAASAAKKVSARPRTVAVAATAAKPDKKKKRNLSPEGRKRIAEAVRKRWARQKAAGAK
jgi:hypothetical protein